MQSRTLLRSLSAVGLTAILATLGAPAALGQTAQTPPIVTVSNPLQKEIVE
jgi:hypothetical protein